MIQHFKLFEDAVTFDTTYKTNVYSLIFEMFCGVNHHRKTVIFGSAFLRLKVCFADLQICDLKAGVSFEGICGLSELIEIIH
ncbi:hypothetical protein ZOSMA_134G00130 [Zostera marina]|uniref:MULE transposase domain-containing protein n=1 Tax=Zostera marina TaxID=29655 RepID=A0A0K9PYM6_ZOSMR|nr:hypothetical protein ZOSMA_134G00130 [Zostera marina]